MWAHYANKHRGICLEFNANDELFCQAIKISYAEDYPIYDLTDETVNGNLMPLTSKSKAWEYEDEYRLIAQVQDASNTENTLVACEDRVNLPENSLISVIIGCLAPEGIEEDIRRITDQASAAIEIKFAERSRDQYKISITSEYSP